jgi:hypothetical protein
MAKEEGRKHRLAREYLICTPILEVAVQQVLRRVECSPIFCSGGELRLAARTRRLHPDFRGVPR